MVSKLEQMQVLNGAGPGFWRSKRSLFASRTSCNVILESPKFGHKNKTPSDIEQQPPFGNRKYSNTLPQKGGYKTKGQNFQIGNKSSSVISSQIGVKSYQ